MTALTTRLIVAQDGSLSTADPLPAGEYIVSAGRDEVILPSRSLCIEDWPTLDLVPLNPDATFSREEIYGDDMR